LVLGAFGFGGSRIAVSLARPKGEPVVQSFWAEILVPVLSAPRSTRAAALPPPSLNAALTGVRCAARVQANTEAAMADEKSAADKAKLYAGRAGVFAASVISSWPALAVSTLCLVAFASHLVWSPDRLPPFGGLSLAQIGLPSPPDLGELNEPLREAGDAAQRQARAAIEEREAAGEPSFLEAHPQFVRPLNIIGFFASFVAFAFTIGIQARRMGKPAAA
jgi:hypothetical protein